MEENKILYSDASYDCDTKTTSISVYDLEKDSYDTKIYKNVPNSCVAEEMALKTSIMLAISRDYRNVVFVYDCLSIDVEKLRNEYKQFFDVVQFLWLKREFLNRVDSCARKVLRECFASKSNSKPKAENKQEPRAKQENKYEMLKVKELRNISIEDMISFFEKNILSGDEINLLKGRLVKKNKDINIDGLRAICSLVRDSKICKKFYNKIKSKYPKIDLIENFRARMSDKDILNVLNKKSPAN